MLGIKTSRTAGTLIRGHALLHHVMRGHDELGTDATPEHGLARLLQFNGGAVGQQFGGALRDR